MLENKKLRKEIKNIRVNWAKNDKLRDMNKTIPNNIKCYYDISYGDYKEFNLLDIYMLNETNKLTPTIINIHGGAFVYGSKEIYKYYCMNLAQSGFIVVNINYRLSPEDKFPSQIIDINNVMKFIYEKGKDYYIDKDNLVIIGDSAGANLTSYYSALYSNNKLQEVLNIKTPDVKIKAIGLSCGLYNNKDIVLNKNDDLLIEYLGLYNKKIDEEVLSKIDIFRYINSNYPPSFIFSSYEDFLLPEAKPFYDILIKNKVESKFLIYGEEGNKKIGHVFNVDYLLEEAIKCNNDQIEFFKKYVDMGE